MGQTTHTDERIALERIQVEGTSNFAGPGGATITHNLDWDTYIPSIIPTADPLGAIGSIWVTDIAANSFVVRNSGIGVTGFTYIINRT